MIKDRFKTTPALLRKVPEITALFWIIKLSSTAMGESVSDFFVNAYNPIFVVGLGFLGFLVFLFIQLRSSRYVAWKYWACVSMVAVFGTMAADVIHVGLGVPYILSSAGFLVILLTIFSLWQRTEGSLSIHSITTKRREYFYWLTVISTFALGTAVGDLTASTLSLGYFGSVGLFGVLLVVALFLWKVVRSKEVLFFWVAYILTRPLGASVADGFGKARSVGGLGLGDGLVSLILIITMIVLIAFISLSRNEKNSETQS